MRKSYLKVIELKAALHFYQKISPLRYSENSGPAGETLCLLTSVRVRTLGAMDTKYIALLQSGSDNKRTDSPFSTDRPIRSLIITNAPDIQKPLTRIIIVFF